MPVLLFILCFGFGRSSLPSMPRLRSRVLRSLKGIVGSASRPQGREPVADPDLSVAPGIFTFAISP